MIKTGNRTMITWVALLLALLLLLPAPETLAAELSSVPESSAAGESSSQPEDSTAEESSSQAESSSQVEESSQASGESSVPEEESVSSEESSLPSESSTAEDGEASQQESSSLEDSEEDTFAAYPLLVTGGHAAYMHGEAGAMFYPSRAMTRAEMAAMLYNLLAAKPPVTESNFEDVDSGDWYYTAVNALAEAGILSGYGDGTFRPGDTVSRAEFVAALCQCFQMEAGSSDFSDVEGHWAQEYIEAATSAGWLSGFEDGTFRPDADIQRCQVTPIMNKALDRTGDGFAADRNTQEFLDVPTGHWAFLHIAEAADPVEDEGGGDDPSVDPPGGSDFEVGQTVRVTATDGLRLREGPGTNYDSITVLATGTLLTVTSVASNGWLGVETSGGQAGFVSSEYVAVHTGGGGTAEGAALSTYSLTLCQYQSALLNGSVESNLSAMRWDSSDSSVAYVGYTVPYGDNVESAVIYGANPGTATITFTDDAGATATCQVTVTAAEDVRSAYAEGNIVARNTDFDLVAITDTSKTEVRFEIVSGSPATGAYTTTSYEEESQVSSYGLPTNNVHVFRRTVQFTAAGTYTVRAYSRSSSSASWSSDYYEFTVQVTSTNVSATTATDDVRRASGEIITVLGDFEGFVPEIEADPLVAGSPTVGYGLVIRPNGTFYNNMTRDEAYALLVNTVNKESYASAVESYRASHNIKMSQAQFDALTSFVYNHGPGVLSTQYGYMTVLLNAVDPSDIDNGAVSGTINNTDVDLDAVPVYSTPGGSSRTATLGYGVTVSVTDYEFYHGSTQQEVWYYVTAGSVKGWISAGYVKLSGSRQCDLTYVDSTVLANNFLQWNTGGIEGLVNRRIAECNIFFFGDYEKAMKASGYWGVNYYGYHFPDDIAYLDSNQ